MSKTNGCEIPTPEKPLKICCACPDTRLPRDECIVRNGEDRCLDQINAHNDCLRRLGFKVSDNSIA